MQQSSHFSILFSDLDGTCVHYKDEYPFDVHPPSIDTNSQYWQASFHKNDINTKYDVLRLPPSSSGSQGIISKKTLQLFNSLRQKGTKLVLISGCRSTTLFERLPYLPAADAYVCESGGRIFYPSTASSIDPMPTACSIEEDFKWRSSHMAAGPIGQEGIAPVLRNGTLWKQYVALDNINALDSSNAKTLPHYRLDCRSYTTAFRVKTVSSNEDGDDVQKKERIPLLPGLSAAINLGAMDIYPSTSGKKNAALYLMEKFRVKSDDCLFMCDDDNDIELALTVRKAYLPGITSESMRKTVENNPERFYVSTKSSIFATEEILTYLNQIV